MARNGSGTYTLYTGNPISSGSTSNSTLFNNTLSDIATALTNSVAANGETPITADQPMSNYKHTGVGSATARTNYCTAAQSQDNTFDWLSSVSGTDTITASNAINPGAYAAGQTFRFISAGANTGAVTLNVNSLGAKAIKKDGTAALVAGDIPSGAVVEVVYDGTNFQLVRNGAANRGANSDITSLTGLTGETTIKGAALGGYGTGAGGAVTQLTDKSTAVTLNKPTGQITMNNALLASGAVVYFTVSNSLVSANDLIIVTGSASLVDSVNYRIEVARAQAGSFTVRVTNISGGGLSEALVINFAVIKGATS